MNTINPSLRQDCNLILDEVLPFKVNVDYKYSYIGTPKNNEYPLISHISFRCEPNDIFPTGYRSVFIQSVFFENYNDINIALTDILKEVVLEIEPNYFNNNIFQLSLF